MKFYSNKTIVLDVTSVTYILKQKGWKFIKEREEMLNQQQQKKNVTTIIYFRIYFRNIECRGLRSDSRTRKKGWVSIGTYHMEDFLLWQRFRGFSSSGSRNSLNPVEKSLKEMRPSSSASRSRKRVLESSLEIPKLRQSCSNSSLTM